MTGTKRAGTFVRMCGVVAFVAAVGSGWDAEAGWRRRCCPTPCCEPVCCETVCCDTCAPATVCGSRCSTWYDACGRRIDNCCGCTVVSSRIVTTCCDVATSATGGPTLAAGGAKSAVAVKPVAVRAAPRR